MEVLFGNRHLADICASDGGMRRVFGTVRTKRIQLRLAQLRAAETLEDMRIMTGRCHVLKGGRRGCLAVDLDGSYRLIFQPVDWIEKRAGGLDWLAVRSVVVLEVTDYH